MAEIYPNYSGDEINSIASEGERKLYRAFNEQLDENYLIFSQASWLNRVKEAGVFTGEADFILAHPKLGILIIEVKGGGVGFDGTTWQSIDRNGYPHKIKNPYKQSNDAKYSVSKKLRELGKINPQVINTIQFGHSVFFPDIDDVHELTGADRPIEITGRSLDLLQIEKWINQVFEYWRQPNLTGPNKFIKDALINTFSRTVQLKVGRFAQYLNIEQKMIQLTENQIEVLNLLTKYTKAVIQGGAGTGKTILATEKARKLSEQGFKTLYLCYNKPLADQISRELSDVQICEISTLHSFFLKIVKLQESIKVDELIKTNGSEAFFEDLLPEMALSYLGPYLLNYDAIIIDEAQDFQPKYWEVLGLLEDQLAEIFLYIFIDPNQNLRNVEMKLPIAVPPFVLQKNCRNTNEIFAFAYKNVDLNTENSGIEGIPIQREAKKNLREAAQSIQHELSEIFRVQSNMTTRIAILLDDGRNVEEFKKLLESKPLPIPYQYRSVTEIDSNSIVVESVARFKGLEADLVFMVCQNEYETNLESKIIYVGASRAVKELQVFEILG